MQGERRRRRTRTSLLISAIAHRSIAGSTMEEIASRLPRTRMAVCFANEDAEQYPAHAHTTKALRSSREINQSTWQVAFLSTRIRLQNNRFFSSLSRARSSPVDHRRRNERRREGENARTIELLIGFKLHSHMLTNIRSIDTSVSTTTTTTRRRGKGKNYTPLTYR